MTLGAVAVWSGLVGCGSQRFRDAKAGYTVALPEDWAFQPPTQGRSLRLGAKSPPLTPDSPHRAHAVVSVACEAPGCARAGIRAHDHRRWPTPRASSTDTGRPARVGAGGKPNCRESWVVVDNLDLWFLDTLDRNYRRERRRWFASPEVFWPKAGARLRPEVGYARRNR